jgi:Domain of unknown function (DUF5666)
MRWKGFGIVAAALVAAVALPLSALGDNTTPTATKGGGWFAGAVTSTSSSSVSLDVLWTGPHDTQLNGTNVTVDIDSSTKIVYGKGHTSIEDGDLIGVRATGIGSATLTAKEIHVRCNCHFAAGTLGSIGASSFAVNVSRTGPYDTVLKGNAVTFQVNGSTVFVRGKDMTAGAISDLKTGEKVAVIFAATGFFKDPNFNWQTATFTAKHVRYRGSLQPAPANP